MLQVARLAPKLLGDSADLVGAFLDSQLHPSGGFRDRSGEPDLYYTVFGLEAMTAIRREIATEPVARFLAGFADGENLDFVHLACLVRAWANISRYAGRFPAERLLARLETFRTPDGGYNQSPDSAHGTAYAAFLAMGAYQDLRCEPPRRERLMHSLASLRASDGGYANVPAARSGVTTATAAVVALTGETGPLADWLLERMHPEGGFYAVPAAPIPDLLSTATALHALSTAQVSFDRLREPCLDFIDSLWTNRGGFYGHWSDDAIDTEYTYYGLLALGHLAV